MPRRPDPAGRDAVATAPAPSPRRHLLTAALGLGLSAIAPRTNAEPSAQIARADLLAAIRRNDPHAIRTALLRGAVANSLDEFGAPVIAAAAKAQSWDAVRALAELRGTDVDAVDRGGANAMMYAALHGELDLVKMLVGRKAEVNKTGWTALHFAAANGHVEVIRFLLERHAYIDAESPNGTTPLMMAARQAQTTAVQVLVEEGADPTPRNASGLDAAAYARAAGNPKLSEWLASRALEFGRKYGTPSPQR
jgi:ankyrin repeat protein